MAKSKCKHIAIAFKIEKEQWRKVYLYSSLSPLRATTNSFKGSNTESLILLQSQQFSNPKSHFKMKMVGARERWFSDLFYTKKGGQKWKQSELIIMQGLQRVDFFKNRQYKKLMIIYYLLYYLYLLFKLYLFL